MFIDSFKYYKARNSPPDLKNVINVPFANDNIVRKITVQSTDEQLSETLGLKPQNSWKVFKFVNIPGLIFIKNPFTPKGQQFWITKCLKDYSGKPNKLNIDNEIHLFDENKSWWDFCFENCSKNHDLIYKLRWATLGYHHNWDTKLYSENSKTVMPQELSDLTEYLSKATGFSDFKAEAAIINYYKMNSTLAGHTDHSEINIKAPLFSISFGQTAIFLIGGLSKEDPAEAVFLTSGDIIIMSGESRLRYHGIPKIMSTNDQPWEFSNDLQDTQDDENWSKVKLYINQARININVRQVLKKGQISL